MRPPKKKLLSLDIRVLKTLTQVSTAEVKGGVTGGHDNNEA